ncbi:hypothetical protein [Ruminococcus flavefaciens]|uniref:hypothetical protein n=1 Tax=Ruminococcus flavefaciens TaxID=1265 RepID=UPI00350E3FD4
MIADSFEGERADETFTKNLLKDRKNAKNDPNAQGFYVYMHGQDWEQIVDNDTDAIIRHQKEIGAFFHKPLEEMRCELLLTGSKEDSFMNSISDDYYEQVYGNILKMIPKGRMHLFPKGDHPAMISNFKEFYERSIEYLSN